MLIYIVNMLITFVLACISIYFDKKDKSKASKIFLALTILVPSIIAGLRYNCGTDYMPVYQRIFESVQVGIETNRNRSIETLYIILNKIAIWLNGDINLVMFFVALITNGFFIAGIYHYRKKIYFPFAVGIYILIYYQMSYNAVRQMMAQAIVFYSIKYLNMGDTKEEQRKNIIRFYRGVLLAFLCHNSAVIAITFPIINFIVNKSKIKFLKEVVYAILLISMLNLNNIYLIAKQIPGIKNYSGYLIPKEGGRISIWYFVKTIPILFPFILLRDEINSDKELKFQFSMIVFGSILNILNYYSKYFGGRIATYFIIQEIIMIPGYLKLLKNTDRTIGKFKIKYLLYITMIAYTIFYTALWYNNYIRVNMHHTYPYKGIMQKEEEYKKWEEKGRKEAMKYEKSISIWKDRQKNEKKNQNNE